MELIKRIKEAEAEAKNTIEQARIQAVKLAEDDQAKQDQELNAAEQQRKAAIAGAVETAEAAGQKECEELNTEGEQRKQELAARVRSRMDVCVGKIVSQLRG